MANVDCSRAPYGESVARYGRDEFRLGLLFMRHAGKPPAVPRVIFRKIDREMRAACRAKFYGARLRRYARHGLPPARLASDSVGSIAAAAIGWQAPNDRSGGTAVPPARTASAPVPARPATVSGGAHAAAAPALIHYTTVTSNFPACPRRVDLKRFLVAALIDKTRWPQAEAEGKRHGCIELHAGDRVHRVRTDRWEGVTQVRPKGRTGTYWTDAVVVR